METIISKLLAASLVLTGAFTHAADLESLAKTAATPATEITQPFTEQELIDHVRAGNFDVYGDGLCPSGYRTYAQRDNQRKQLTEAERVGCEKRLNAFSDKLFGECHMMRLNDSGGIMMSFVLKYAMTPNEDTESRQKILKNVNDYLENFRQPHPSTNCTPAHYETLKNLANKVLDAATQVTDEAKQHIAEKEAAEMSKRAEADAKQKALDACKDNSAYDLYQINSAILGLQVQNAQFKAAIDQEKAAAELSGYANQENLNLLGRRIVINEERITRFFARYRELGGTASKADAIKPVANPCPSDSDID